jgi:PAS domain S-box-containing protein
MNYQIKDILLKHSTFGYSYDQIILDESGTPCDYVFLDTNRAFLTMLGLDLEKVEGKRVSEINPTVLEDSFDWVGFFGKVALTGESAEIEAFSSALNKWFHLSVFSPMTEYFVVISFDITDQKTMEQDLVRSKEELREYIDNAPDGVFITDNSLHYIYANSAARQMTGYSMEEMHSLQIKDLLSAEDEAGNRKSLIELRETKRSARIAHIMAKDGSKITVDVNIVSLNNGKLMAFCKDITKLEQTENEKNQYYSAFQNTSQPILITDQDGTILSVNNSFTEMYGYSRDEVVGKKPNILNPGREVYDNLGIGNSEYETMFRDLWSSVRDPLIRTWKGEVINRRKNNTLVWISLLVNAVYNETGSLQSIIGFPVDMTVSHEVAQKNRIQLYKTIADLAELRDDDTGNHMKRVGLFAKLLAREMGKSVKFCDDIEMFAPMHDIGKVGILDSILMAPRKLTPEEFQIMKTHTTLGHNIIKGKKEFEMAAAITLCHHEKFDGTGYPHGIEGKHIPLSAHITALCDIYDALRSRRPYKEPWTHEDAVKHILGSSGSHFDPDLIAAFARLSDRFQTVFQELTD